VSSGNRLADGSGIGGVMGEGSAGAGDGWLTRPELREQRKARGGCCPSGWCVYLMWRDACCSQGPYGKVWRQLVSGAMDGSGRGTSGFAWRWACSPRPRRHAGAQAAGLAGDGKCWQRLAGPRAGEEQDTALRRRDCGWSRSDGMCGTCQPTRERTGQSRLSATTPARAVPAESASWLRESAGPGRC